MTDLQQVELDILKVTIEIIEKHKLRYFLIGGTTLGAIRHKGFIPWDDDIDIAMPRADYDKLMKLGAEFKGKFFLQNFISDPKYPYNFAKVRDSSTTFKERQFAHIKMNQGVYIDVFPLDGVSLSKKTKIRDKWKIYSVWFRFYIIYLGRLFRPVHLRSCLKDIPLNIIAALFCTFNAGHFLNKSIEKTMHKLDYDAAYLVANIQGANFKKEILERSLFGEGTRGTFEDLLNPVIESDYDVYLSKIYGDYMTPPPLDKREGHHYHSGFSLTESYLTYKDNR